MLRIAVLGSTSGTDLQAIIAALQSGELCDVELACVISNKEDAFILERAKQAGFTAIYLPSQGLGREDYDRKLAKILDKNNVELLILIGYMRFLSPWFIDKYRNKVMNIHPSLLPAFAGGMDKNVHEDVLKAKVPITGATLHFVDEGADSGPIIAQKEVTVAKNDTVDTLKAKVQAAEQEIILQGIKDFRDGKLKIQN
ncbi:MAG: phosphoribosylglycinamide formyltransferase [Candidatus Gracilibacteria bacterium]|nr:phosphoribosylglycinamide formyltransferase [Candidatus Gracilibacteria bacterium]